MSLSNSWSWEWRLMPGFPPVIPWRWHQTQGVGKTGRGTISPNEALILVLVLYT